MTLIVMKNSFQRLPFYLLYQLVIKSIFDPKNMTSSEISAMQHSIVNWANWIEEEKSKKLDMFGPGWQDETLEVGKRGNPIDEAEFWLGICAGYIDRDQKGLMEGQKATMIIHNLDYRKVFHFPGAVSGKDRELARKALAENIREQPELYR